MPQLMLYLSPFCPFCRKVLNFMGKNNITLPQKNISEKSECREELITIGGKGQVPCLVIDGYALYESDDIIQWLKDNQDKL